MKTEKAEYWRFLEDLEYRLYETYKKADGNYKQDHEGA